MTRPAASPTARWVVVAALAVLVVGAGGLVAAALWSDSRAGAGATLRTGAVTFAAQVAGDGSTRVASADGGPVTVTLPGAQIVRVLDQTGPDPAPVFWRFEATGAALGIAGLTYDVAVTGVVDADGVPHDLVAGQGLAGTVLDGSVVTIYPAAAGGDCSTVPDPDPGQQDADVRVHGGEQDVLQPAGSNPTGGTRVRAWCVAMDWRDDPDGAYASEARAVATGQDGTTRQDRDTWDAVVAFPRTLDPVGSYANRAQAEGTAQDGSPARDSDDWTAVLFPDPSAEPDLVITLDPAVTTLAAAR
jgi:hypothetical protein